MHVFKHYCHRRQEMRYVCGSRTKKLSGRQVQQQRRHLCINGLNLIATNDLQPCATASNGVRALLVSYTREARTRAEPTSLMRRSVQVQEHERVLMYATLPSDAIAPGNNIVHPKVLFCAHVVVCTCMSKQWPQGQAMSSRLHIITQSVASMTQLCTSAGP